MASTVYFFDSSGTWIAFRKGIYVFGPAGDWLGWMIEPDLTTIVDVEGHYLGTVVSSDRVFRELFPKQEYEISHPGYPGREVPPDHPGYPGRCEVPTGMEDVRILEHA